MLTVTIRSLERDGLISRTVYPVVPPRVEYALTPLGESLLQAATTLLLWADAHQADLSAARDRYDEANQGDFGVFEELFAVRCASPHDRVIDPGLRGQHPSFGKSPLFIPNGRLVPVPAPGRGHSRIAARGNQVSS
jgi:hypothetical protein